jgi:hypothetical protein
MKAGDTKRDLNGSRQRVAAVFAQGGRRRAKLGAESAGKSFVALPARLESDLEHGGARVQEEPGAAIQPPPPLMRSRRFAHQLQGKPMKMAAGKTSRSRHHRDASASFRRIQPAAESSGRLGGIEMTRHWHARLYLRRSRVVLTFSAFFLRSIEIAL